MNSFKKDLAKRIYTTLGVYEFLNIHIFKWYKALFTEGRHGVSCGIESKTDMLHPGEKNDTQPVNNICPVSHLH